MVNANKPRFVSAVVLLGTRIVYDPRIGRRWTVQEIHDRRHSDAPNNGRSLVFSRVSAARRLRQYPADWAQLTDTALLRLALQN